MNKKVRQLLSTYDYRSAESINEVLESIPEEKKLSETDKLALTQALTEVFYNVHHMEGTCMPKVAMTIVKQVGRYGKSMLPYLFQEMVDADSESAVYFGKAISRNKQVGLKYVLSQLDNPIDDDHALINCLQSLAYFKIPEVVKAISYLIKAQKHHDVHVIAMSLYVTGRIVQKLHPENFSIPMREQMYSSALSCLSSSDVLVRKNAARTLGKMFKLKILSKSQETELHKAFLAITGDNHEHNWDRSYIVRREAEDFLPLFTKPKNSVLEYSQSFKILKKRTLCKDTYHYVVEAPFIARKIEAGQFIIVRPHLHSERIPLSICGWDRIRGTIDIIVAGVGRTTIEMNKFQEGDCYEDMVGPLGNRSHLPETSGTCVVVGGGYGAGAIIPTATDLKADGNEVIAIVGARSKSSLIMLPELNEICDEIIVTTADGTKGIKGLVTDALSTLLTTKKVVHILAVGPVPMMKAISEMTNSDKIPTYVSLNAIMVDGTGMCGACRVSIDHKTQFACFHGPDFDGHLVDFDNLMKRQKMFIKEEDEAVLAMNEEV